MIPKLIHYCWFGGKEKSEDVKKYIASWRKYCPDYEIKEWNESNFDINENDYCREAYEAKKWAFVTDYVRLKALFEEGGFYMDTDVEMVKSLNPLCSYDAVFGYESATQIQTGIMGACLGNEWIGMLLHDYDHRHFLLKDGTYDTTTNVKVVTDLTVKKFGLHLHGQKLDFGHNMIILPFDFLCAKDFISGQIMQTSNTYTVHHFEGSWYNDEDKYASQMKLRMSKILPYGVAGHLAAYLAAYKFNGFRKANLELLKWVKKHM